uniref:Dynein regulatory complex protein 10 n=1 Tax=Mola mola TaxID=94237 RepID=A0A3Q3XBD0_MOLML
GQPNGPAPPSPLAVSANTATMLAKSHFADSLQCNELIEKKLLSPEGKCIAGILTNCNSNIEIAAILPTFLCLNNVSSIVDEELRRALQKHQILEEKLKTLEGLEQEPDREQEGRKNETAQVEEGIKNSFRNLLRLFRACSDVVSAWKAELGMKVGMSENIRELHTSLSLILEKSLSSRDKKLQFDPSKQLSHALAKQRQSCLEASQATIVRLQQEIDQLNILHNNFMHDHRLSERALQEVRLCHIYVELKETEYEQQMEELRKLEMQISALEVDYNSIQERRHLAEEMVERELELKTKAAIFAQAWWRGYSTRKALEKKEKSRKVRKDKRKKTK